MLPTGPTPLTTATARADGLGPRWRPRRRLQWLLRTTRRLLCRRRCGDFNPRRRLAAASTGLLPSCAQELACLISEPGSQQQPLHPDTPYTPRPPLYAAFVALQDVDVEMGPTIYLPGTHTKEEHTAFQLVEDGLHPV